MSRSRDNRKLFTWITAGVLLQATTLAATIAAAGDADDQWEYEATIYLWTPDIHITSQSNTDTDVSFNQIYQNLDMAAMGTIGARKGKWSLLLDTVYMDLSGSDGGSHSVRDINTILTFDVDASVTTSVTTLTGGYNVFDEDGTRFDLIAGARYLWVDVDLKVKGKLTGDDLPDDARKLNASGSDDALDAIVGGRGQYGFNESWYLPYYLDFGGGQSKLTYQAMAGVGYKFGWGDVTAAYRYLGYKFGSDYVIKDLTIDGPVFGATFRF